MKKEKGLSGKKEKLVTVGISKKNVSDALNKFYKESLAPKLDQIDQRFAQVDKKFQQIETQLVEFREDTLHQFRLISEDLTSKVQQVAEGVIS